MERSTVLQECLSGIQTQTMEENCAGFSPLVSGDTAAALQPLKHGEQRLFSTQCLQIAIMMGLKRYHAKHPGEVTEPWLDWHKRRYRTARNVSIQHHIDIRASLTNKRNDWAAHISRFGTGPRCSHLLKAILLWRPLAWWKMQQKALERGLSTFRHPGHLHPRRWEEHFRDSWLFDNLDNDRSDS